MWCIGLWGLRMRVKCTVKEIRLPVLNRTIYMWELEACAGTPFITEGFKKGQYWLSVRRFDGIEVDWELAAGPLAEIEINILQSCGIKNWRNWQ